MIRLFRASAGIMLGVTIVFMILSGICGCAPATAKHALSVSTTPPDALVCIGSPDGEGHLTIQTIAGTTPLEKQFQFGPEQQLWLQIEKRGYAPHRLSVGPDSGPLAVDLDRLHGADGLPAPEFGFPAIKRAVLVWPRFSVFERGFGSETISDAASAQAQQALNSGISAEFGDRWEILGISGQTDAAEQKALWRDGNTALELTNPVRLRYLPEPLLLETTSGRGAAQTLGRRYGADVVVLVTGKAIVETGSMLAGKLGMTVIGTATSYAGGYGRAMANGDSYFVYTVYTPHFSEGTLLKAMMIDCRNGEVLWTNQGFWPRIDFKENAAVGKIVADLFTGIPHR